MTRVRAGLTLLETTVVLVLLALGAGMAVPAFRAVAAGTNIAAASATVRQVMERSRARALQGAVGTTLTVDPANGRVWEQPGDTSYALGLPSGCALAAGAARVRLQWRADGSAAGDTLRVRCGSAGAMLHADGLTGAVRAEAEP